MIRGHLGANRIVFINSHTNPLRSSLDLLSFGREAVEGANKFEYFYYLFLVFVI